MTIVDERIIVDVDLTRQLACELVIEQEPQCTLPGEWMGTFECDRCKPQWRSVICTVHRHEGYECSRDNAWVRITHAQCGGRIVLVTTWRL